MTSYAIPCTLSVATVLALLLTGPVMGQSTETSEPATSEAAGQSGETSTTDEATTQSEPADDSAAAAEAPAPDADAVLATVDGEVITLADVIAVRQALPDQYQQLPDEVLLTGIVEQIAEQIMLENAAKKTGLADTPLVQKAIRSQTRAVLADAYMTEALQNKITEERIAEEYKLRFLDAEPVVEVQVAHVLVADYETAANIKAQIDGGADFAAMAAEHGSDGTSARGGDIGWITRGQMVPEFADAAFAMEPGEISGPVETPFGWHLIKVDGKRDQPVPLIEEVRGSIIEELSQTISTDVLNELRGTSNIERNLDSVDATAIRADDLIDN